MSNIKIADIDEFCRRMKIDVKAKIDIALLVELLDKFADEQVNKKNEVAVAFAEWIAEKK